MSGIVIETIKAETASATSRIALFRFVSPEMQNALYLVYLIV